MDDKYFLVKLRSFSSVHLEFFLGVCNSKSGVYGLIYNYHKFNEYWDEKYDLKSDLDINDINILLISKSDYDYFENLYHDKEEDIEKYFSKYKFETTNNLTYFWFGIYVSDVRDREESFTDDEYDKYIFICEQSIPFLI